MNSDMNKKIMARNIKKYMEIKGVTNQQICDALGFKYTTFMDWIKGVTYPRMPKVEAMANYFGILKSDLIEEKTGEHTKMQKKNDVLSDIILKANEDAELLSMMVALSNLGFEQRQAVKSVLNAFSIIEK